MAPLTKTQTETGRQVGLTGNSAIALAMKQIDPGVCPVYPITPSTAIVEGFASYHADGEVTTELVTVESEHSAMSACVGASAAGARVMTATSSQGLALMWEMLYIASGMRLPIVMTVVNRALSAPINIHCDHSDSMGARDSGWIQIYSENVQEAYDNIFQAVRIAEDRGVLTPAMVCMDGFITSHAIENLTIIDDRAVKEFVGDFKPAQSLLDTDNPITMGALALQDHYMEFKYEQSKAIAGAKEVVLRVGEEFGKRFGRSYGLFDAYRLEDADAAIVVLNSAAGTTKVAADRLRAQGRKVGVLKPRLYRPFPHAEIAAALGGVKAVCVLDRADSMNGFGGPLFGDIRSALYDLKERPAIMGRIYGLGGRDYTVEHALGVYDELHRALEAGKASDLTGYITLQ